METFFNGREVFPYLKDLIRSAESSVVGIGAAFGMSIKTLGELIQERMREGVQFKFVCLSRTADLQFWAPRFAQGVASFESQVKASLESLEEMKARAPDRFSYHPTTECPTCRIYIADPESAAPRGIVVFYGARSDTLDMPAVYVSNFLASPFKGMYTDALTWMGRQLHRKVFVIHGHNEAKRRELETLLREFGVEPVVLVDQASGGAATVIEKFEEHAKKCSMAVALFTPDDVVVTDGKEYLQPRTNVIFEVGWFCSHLGRKRVVLLSQRGMAPIQTYNSNLSGVLTHVFSTSVAELYNPLRQELAMAGLIT